MTLLKSSLAIFTIVLFIACSATKTKENTDDISTTTAAKAEYDKMIIEGYTAGTIIYSDLPDDCAYTIQLEGKDIMYDPINLDASYQKHNEKIWFTFSPLRRMNRCIKANPISLVDIKKRL